MGVAHWWSRRRFGLSFEASLASVPAWAPIGHDTSWYRAHVEGDVRDLHLHPGGLAEARRHHALRWAHVEHYEDFLPFLHFDEFDADEWAGIARDAGAGYALMTAKHHDGLCWWDAPGGAWSVCSDGPRRDVLGEFAAACERADIVFGAAYSLLDWHDPRYPGTDFVSEVLHPQVLDLVERYDVRLLWGDAHWGAGGDHWRSDELVATARRMQSDLVVNDRWWAATPDVAMREHLVPDTPPSSPWEFRRPLGTSPSLNRAEPVDSLMTAKQIVALLTEVVAKGGHLQLQVGPDSTGRVPDEHVDRLRAAGGWIRRHAALVDGGQPWEVWGDDDCRYVTVDDELYAIDVSGHGHFGALDLDRGKVVTIETTDGNSVLFDQTDRGTRLARPPRKTQRLPAVYLVTLEPPPPAPIELFPAEPAVPIELAPLLAGSSPGDIVQLGEGRYRGPAKIPHGVTLRGLGPDRTVIEGAGGAVIVVDAGARLAHCRVAGGVRIGRLPNVVVEFSGADATALGCVVDGHIAVAADGGRVTSCTAAGVLAADVDRLEVARSTFHGMGDDTAIDIRGGAHHLVDSCEINDHLTAVAVVGAVSSAITRNRIRARWWGVRLVDTETIEVAANSIERTMRAVDVDGGTHAVVAGNVAADGDSGCVLQHGASNAEVAGNYWDRCRMGLLAWGAGEFRARANTASDLGEPDADVAVGP